MANEQPSGKEMGLIKVASQHKRNAERLSEYLRVAEKSIVKLAKALPDEKIAEEAVWDYVGLANCCWWKGNSALIGVLSTIEDYTDKKGKTFPAHFTEFGHFLCRVSEENPVPFPYDGFFPICEERFRFVMNRGAKELKDFFQPREELKIEIPPKEEKKKAPVKVLRPKVAKKETKPKWDDDE